MNLYHRTDAASDILAEGFRDGEGTYLTRNVYRGVWLSDQVLDVNEGASGEAVLVVDMPKDVVAPFEWVEEWRNFREFLVPAEVVNQYAVQLITVDDPRHPWFDGPVDE